jgi:hypothetical protein
VSESEKKTLNFKVEKVFIGYQEGENPELEPLFANHFELLQIGTDIFLDVGILRPEEVIAMAATSGELQKLTFNVLYRIAMSPQTLARLHLKTAALFESMKPAFESMKGMVELTAADASANARNK